MGVPLVIIHFRLGFSIIKTIHLGVPPHLWNPPELKIWIFGYVWNCGRPPKYFKMSTLIWNIILNRWIRTYKILEVRNWFLDVLGYFCKKYWWLLTSTSRVRYALDSKKKQDHTIIYNNIQYVIPRSTNIVIPKKIGPWS